jgi:hypothetical protein
VLPRGRALLFIDLVLIAWVVLWVGMGAAVAGQVRGLKQLSATATQVGAALQQTGQAVEGLGAVPLVGDRAAQAGRQIKAAGKSTITTGQTTRSSIRTLSWMLWMFLAVIPTVPVLVFYLPLRLFAAREHRALQRLSTKHSNDPRLRKLLAQRALLTLPYQQLATLGQEFWDNPSDAHDELLAAAQLARAGVRLPPPPP